MQVGRGGGGEGEVEFLTEQNFSAKKCSWGLKTPKKRKISEFFFPTNFFFFLKCSWGSETHANKKIWGGDFGVFGARGVGKRYTSSYGHDM